MLFKVAPALIILSLFTGTQLNASGGRLFVKKPQKNFGSVKRGITLTHEFEFTNTGKGPLKIQGVHAACGCTVVGYEPRDYEKGESGIIAVTFDTTNFRGKSSKSVTVWSSDRSHPHRTLTIQANILEDYNAAPPLVDFGSIAGATNLSKDVKLNTFAGFDLQVKGLVYNDKIIKAWVLPNVVETIIRVELNPSIHTGFFRDTLLVQTNNTSLPELPIPIRGFVEGKIKVKPEYLEFGTIDQGESKIRKVYLTSDQDISIEPESIELHINGVEYDAPKRLIKTEITQFKNQQRLLDVELSNLVDGHGSVHGYLTFKTSDLNQKALRVDFYAFFTSGSES